MMFELYHENYVNSNIFAYIYRYIVFLNNMYKIYKKNKNINMKNEIILKIIAGFFAGFVSGFFGAGGGMILVPFMTLILKDEEVESRATTILCIFFMVLISSFFYFKQDAIDWNVSIKCAIGGIVGGIIGSKLLINLDKKILNILFIIFLIYSGIKMIF